MKKITALFGIATSLFLPLSASAADYAYNNYIGKVYVRNVTVQKIGKTAMRYTINIHTPSCPNQYHIDGSVQLRYTAEGGGWFRTKVHQFTGSDEENVDRTFADIVDASMSDNGRTNVETTSKCIYHGIRKGGFSFPL